jgi:hypothetical protein
VPLPPVLHMVGGYLRAPLDVPLPPGVRVACWTGVGTVAVQPDKFRKLLLPGPHNYLGWSARRNSTSATAVSMPTTSPTPGSPSDGTEQA